MIPTPVSGASTARSSSTGRLAPYDIDQSRAHARALLDMGVLDAAELEQLDVALEGVGTEMERGDFEFAPFDEDIHMAIERRLTELVGPLAGKLHTGRSRNDQVATDVAMVVQSHSLRAIELLRGVMNGSFELAERHRDWPMPGYTHLQRAQPVYLGHHLLAYFWMFGRDVLRFQFALDSAGVMPLGSGALAGVNWEIDRRAVADELGFEHVTANSIDGASNRDFVLDYLSAASICAMHLSRLGGEIVLWSSTEFGFCELSESFSSGSSIMPQKNEGEEGHREAQDPQEASEHRIHDAEEQRDEEKPGKRAHIAQPVHQPGRDPEGDGGHHQVQEKAHGPLPCPGMDAGAAGSAAGGRHAYQILLVGVPLEPLPDEGTGGDQLQPVLAGPGKRGVCQLSTDSLPGSGLGHTGVQELERPAAQGPVAQLCGPAGHIEEEAVVTRVVLDVH